MSDLTTKAAEIRARLRTAIELGDRTGVRGKRPENIYNAADDALALIEQQAAELAEAWREADKRLATIDDLNSDAGEWNRRATTAESERDELLREKERLGAGWRDISTAPKDRRRILVRGCVDGPSVRIVEWGTGRYLGRKKGYAEGWQDHPGHTCDPTEWMPLPSEGSGQNLADAHSKSPDPSSQSERIAVLEAALREKDEALKPFASMDKTKFVGSIYETADDDMVVLFNHATGVKILRGDFRRARSALAPLGEE